MTMNLKNETKNRLTRAALAYAQYHEQHASATRELMDAALEFSRFNITETVIEQIGVDRHSLIIAALQSYKESFNKTEVWLEPTSGAPYALLRLVTNPIFSQVGYAFLVTPGGNVAVAVETIKGGRILFYNVVID